MSQSIAHSRLVLVVALLAVLLAAPGVATLRIETATESVLNRYSASWKVYQDFLRQFGSDEYLALLVRGDGDPLDPETLSDVKDLTQRLEAVEGVARVDSLATVPALLVGRDGSLISEPLLGTERRGEGGLGELLDRHRTAENWLISSDRASYGVNAVIDLPVEDHYPAVLSAVAAASDNASIAVSGVPIFRAAANRRMRSDLLWYVPVTLAAVSVLVVLLMGSWGAVGAALSAPVLSVWLTLGAMGASGTPLSITTVVIPPVVLALGCAYAMHALCALQEEGTSGQLGRLLDVARPIALSGVTTTIGFLGLAVVRIEAINVLGVFGAFAVAVLTASTLTLTPAVAKLVGVRLKRRPWDEFVIRRAVALWRASEGRPVAVMTLWAVLVVFGGVAATRIEVSTNVIEWFGEEELVRSDYREIRRALAGISPLAVVIEASEGAPRVTDPSNLRRMHEFLSDVRTWEGVGHAMGVSDFLGQLRAEIATGGGEEVLSSAEAEQLLLLLEGEPMLRGLLSRDRKSAAVLLRLDNNDSGFIREVGAKAESWWAAGEGSTVAASSTGVMMEFAQSQDEIVYGQLRGLSIALAAIAVVLMVTFRNLFLVGICLAVNLLPLLLAVACLWLVDAPMDAATAVITCLALGIAVDDSLHLIYERERRRRVGGLAQAGVSALHVVARPVVFSTVAVLCGFLVLGASSFLPVANLGLVTAGTMVICMLADLTLMPVLLRLGAGGVDFS